MNVAICESGCVFLSRRIYYDETKRSKKERVELYCQRFDRPAKKVKYCMAPTKEKKMGKKHVDVEALKAQFAADGWLNAPLRNSAYCKATKIGYTRVRTVEQVIDSVSAADVMPRELTAREFVTIVQHLCINEFAAGCDGCPLWITGEGCVERSQRPETVVELVEQWAREHPERSEECPES